MVKIISAVKEKVHIVQVERKFCYGTPSIKERLSMERKDCQWNTQLQRQKLAKQQAFILFLKIILKGGEMS